MEQYLSGKTLHIISLLFVIFFCVCLTFSTALVAAEASSPETDERRKTHWSLLGGYGISHTNIGNTKEQVQVLDFIPRYERIIVDDIGNSWYRGHHSLLVEVPFTWVFDPDTAPMVGVNLLGAWTFTSSQGVRPYLFGGGGVLYTGARIPGLGSELNGNWQFGGGVRFKMTGGNWLSVEYRFHHISNTGAKDPNDPINSSKFLVGITF